MGLHNINTLKLAKLHTKNLGLVKDVLVLTVRGLKPFINYKSVQRIIAVVHDELSLIDAHLNKFSDIEKTKGEVKYDADL